MLRLQAERYFSHLSAMLHFNLLRTKNRSTEIEKSFGCELFIVFRHERKLKGDLTAFHSVVRYVTTTYRIT